MSAPTLDRPDTADAGTELPTGWRGPIMPMNTRSGDRREFLLADGAEPGVRPLPQPLNAQKQLAENHNGSTVVGLITRVWVEDGHLWAEGPFDLEDPEARDWAAKVGRGMAGWVSADMSDISVEQVPLDENDEVITDEVFAEFEAAHNAWVEAGAEGTPPPGPDVREVLYRVPSWKLMGVTLVSGPAFESARIEPVYGEEFTPVHAKDALVAAAAVHTGAMIALVPSEEDCARLAVDGYEAPEILHTTLVFLGEAAAWDDTQRDALEQAVRELGLPTSLQGNVFGHARLNPDGDEPCAVYLVEAEGLSSLRAATFGVVAEGGLIDEVFPKIPDPYDNFLPHVTAGYNLDVDQLTETGPIRYDRIRISFADTDVRDIPFEPIGAALVASGIVYDAEDFEQPEPDEYTMVTVTDDGKVFGHIAPWDGCHAAFPDACVSPPYYPDDDYNAFHQGGPVATTNGMVRVGKITFGTGHAGMQLGVQGALAHYDNTGTVGALVRCRNGEHGPFVSGRLLPGLSDHQIHTVQFSAVSGDWRKLRPNARTSARLELIAVLSVNSPGFMAPRNRALVASGAQTLIASGALVTSDPVPEVKPVPASKRIALDQVIANATRATRCAAAAQKVRDARLSMLRSRVEHLKARRVETPEGAKHYGQPVGSIIVDDPDVPNLPGGKKSKDTPDAPDTTADTPDAPEADSKESKIDPEDSPYLDDIAALYRGDMYYRVDDEDEYTSDLETRLENAGMSSNEDYVQELRDRIDGQRRPVPDWPGAELAQPSSEEVNSIAAQWRYSQFYDHIDDWRTESRELQQNGWNHEDWDEWAESPSVGPLVAAIAHNPETESPIYRGMSVNQEYLDQMTPGAEFSMGMSSFTTNERVAGNFARDPAGDGRHADLGEGASNPLVMTVEPGARAVNLGDGVEEHVTMGRFAIVERVERDGTVYITLRQTSPLEAS
ncbi:2'-5' RNA ligase family protein [Rhodococcoides kyotonense]|uniref:2'-5' RNA ligase n=1 Tax=Rhodococcoides kyotonense TaxID=398843 RepID=A0A239FQ31_9NOCA|nr:hypothetical protein [Rhodococcus kyotonensis]SNS58748.1 2'-5' RNA ligase [Rhodococcus kyotonensis]